MPHTASLFDMSGTTHVDRLVDHLTGGHADTLAGELRAWARASRRFRAFLEDHRDKVRKKLRTARDADARLDVRAELAVAHALLADSRIELAWEASGARVGGPDFTVAYRGRPALTLEVTRWRGTPEAVRHGRPLLAKLRQLPVGSANAVLLAVGPSAAVPEPGAMVEAWRARAAADDDAYFARVGLAGVRDFRTRLGRLGGVIVWTAGAGTADGARLWRNPAARILLPSDAARAILVALGGSPEYSPVP
jgi:hypothetical protein